MAYALGFPKDVTKLIYIMRDPNNWNGDKFKSTPVGRLFTWPGLRPQYMLALDSWPQCRMERDPEAPFFFGWGQIESISAFVEGVSVDSTRIGDNLTVLRQDPKYDFSYHFHAVLKLERCYGDLAKPFDFFTCEPCLPNNEIP